MQRARIEIKTLSGFLPICSFCKNIRDEQGAWNQIKAYVAERSNAKFSHSYCPECVKIHYPE